MLIENIRLALAGLRSNIMRSILTMLGIIIGIGSVIGIMTVGNSLSSSVTSSMSELGTSNITVGVTMKDVSSSSTNEDGLEFGEDYYYEEPTADDYISASMIKDITEHFADKVQAVEATASLGQAKVSNGSDRENVNITGVNLGSFIVNSKDLLAGSIFSSRDFDRGSKVALIADDLATDIYGDVNSAVGKSIELNYNNKYESYTVVGVYNFDESSSFSMSSATPTTTLYVPLLTAQNETHNYTFSTFTIMAKNVENYDAFTKELTNYINARYYRNNEHFETFAYSMSTMLSTLTSMLSTITLAISVIAGISLLVGGIGVMNIMLVSVSERTNEIGTRKALGATNGNIQMQFIVESVIICLIGGIIGVALGIGIGAIGSKLMGSAASISYSSIAISLIFSMSIGVFFGFYPARKAAQMNPIDALRY